jgi:hypothetical protein
LMPTRSWIDGKRFEVQHDYVKEYAK